MSAATLSWRKVDITMRVRNFLARKFLRSNTELALQLRGVFYARPAKIGADVPRLTEEQR
jgi:hypothetical protein